MTALRLAVGTLTVVPVGPLPGLDRRTSGLAMLLAPVAVLPLAVTAAGVAALAELVGLPGLIVGLLTVATLALGTRAMHLDGLADTVDGLGSGWDRERALAVMRRGDIGPMGAVALMVVLGLQGAALGALVDGWRTALAAVALVCAARTVLAMVCRRGVPAARAQGLGVGVAGTVAPGAAYAVAALGVALAVTAQLLAGRAWWTGLVSGLLAVVAVLGLTRHCVRRFGGVTGDVMGAAVELAFTVVVVGAAAWG